MIGCREPGGGSRNDRGFVHDWRDSKNIEKVVAHYFTLQYKVPD
jgi:hypothetical protein